MVGLPVISRTVTTPTATSVSVYDVPSFDDGTPREGNDGWMKVWSRSVLQDYRGMSAHHKNVCNVLMADGSIQSLVDENDDQFINNGFEANADFASSDVEAGPLSLASYYNLQTRGGK
jgi:prepilin-type processing-associated H-X9-DG protein